MATPRHTSEMKDSKGNLHKTTIFWANAEAEYAKSVVFAAESIVALWSGQYMWAAIASYYSFFHLSISLVYMVPTLVDQTKLTELIDSRRDGVADPTSRIQHKDLPIFLANCQAAGLTPKLRELVLETKELREFVTYRPKVEWGDEKLYFRTRRFSRSDVNHVIEALPHYLNEALLWANKQGDSPQLLAEIAALSLSQFLEKDDLLYKDWCSPEVLSLAEEIRRGLSIRLENH